MARSKKQSPLSIQVGSSERLRYHGDVEGNARVIFDLLAAQPAAIIDQVLSKLDGEEDFYLVHLKRHKNPAMGISSTGRATHLGQVLLRYGDDRLLEAGLMGLIKNGHHRILLLGEAMKLGRLDWVENIAQSLPDHEHQDFAIHGYEHGPLFYWAASPPPPDQHAQYATALDTILRLPPYFNRRTPINEGLGQAFESACVENNVAALEELGKRGIQPNPKHLPLAISTCANQAFDWLAAHGALEGLSDHQQTNDHLLPAQWAKALFDTRHDDVHDVEQDGPIRQVLDLAARLFTVPGVAREFEQLVASSSSDHQWATLFLGAALEARAPEASRSPARTRRI